MPNVTYIKLAPYLASYWRVVMNLKNDEPLVLPSMEARMYLHPFLKENKNLERSQSRNSKGYYKDANSYSQYAYNVAVSGTHDICVDKEKVPTIAECAKLQPVLLPKTIMVNKSEIPTNEFYELKDKGVTKIREYIRDYFYYELHAHVVGEQRRACRLNKIADTTLSVETFLYNLGIGDECNCNNVRTMLYEWDEQRFAAGDPDSIRRAMYSEVSKRNLPNIHSQSRKKY